MMDRVTRWTPANPCPICAGHPALPQGQGVRCHGFASSDGAFAHCTREEHAGELALHRGGTTFAHRLGGPCRCGMPHREAAGLAARPSPLRRINAVPRLWNVPSAAVEMTHSYFAPDGSLAFEVIRFWRHARDRYGKTRPRHKGADGRLYWGQGEWTGRPDKPLYGERAGLAELLAGGTIFVCEGERDVDAVGAAGLVAVCAPDGAGGFKDHHADILIEAMTAGEEDAGPQHATVRILADRDETGMAAGRRIRMMLCQRCPSALWRVSLERPPAGIKDAAAFLESRGEL